jgi:glutathione S-transferase
MIDLYYWTTPNGHKITIFLEESGLDYNIKPINISKGEQFEPAFLKIAPNNRIPAIVDQSPSGGGEPIGIFESGAILLYLADKTQQFVPQDLRGRNECLQWLFWQMGGLGPMAGQNHHFVQYAPESLPYAIDRYVKETSRLYGVLNKHLSDGREYICGDIPLPIWPPTLGSSHMNDNARTWASSPRWPCGLSGLKIAQRQCGLMSWPSPSIPRPPWTRTPSRFCLGKTPRPLFDSHRETP